MSSWGGYSEPSSDGSAGELLFDARTHGARVLEFKSNWDTVANWSSFRFLFVAVQG